MTKTLQNSRTRTPSACLLRLLYKKTDVRFVIVYLNQRCYKSYDKQLSRTIVCDFISFSACVTHASQIVYFFNSARVRFNQNWKESTRQISFVYFVCRFDTSLIFTYFHRQFSEAHSSFKFKFEIEWKSIDNKHTK